MKKYICDGCGKEVNAVYHGGARRSFKPAEWFERCDESGEQHACSRECIEATAKKTGKTPLVLPF